MKIPVTYVRVERADLERREAFGRSLKQGRPVYIDMKWAANGLDPADFRPGTVLCGQLTVSGKCGETLKYFLPASRTGWAMLRESL